MAIQLAAERRIPTVIEGTMRDVEKVSATCKTFRAAGFEVDARALAVPERLSWLGVLQRYEAQKEAYGVARMTVPAAHQAAYDGLPVTLARIEAERLADRVGVYRRGEAAPLYRNELDADGRWGREPGAGAALEAERSRRPTLDELRAYQAGYEKLSEQLARPSRASTQEERAEVTLRLEGARNLLAAQVFRELPKGDSLREAPRLAGAYDVLDAAGRELTAGRQAVAREYLAKMIEIGRYPSLERSRGRDEPDR